MAVERSVSWDVEANLGQNVWAVLCRAALRAIGLAAAAFGVTDEAPRVERAELLVAYGVAPPLATAPWQAIDWARLGELERAQLAREARARGDGARASHRHWHELRRPTP